MDLSDEARDPASIEDLQFTAQAYRDDVVYKKGDMVIWTDGNMYKLNERVGVAGYNPGYPGKWTLAHPYNPYRNHKYKPYLDYDDKAVYNTGDMVKWTDGKVYKFNEFIGQPGHNPGHVGKWTQLKAPYYSGKLYRVNDIIQWRNGKILKFNMQGFDIPKNVREAGYDQYNTFSPDSKPDSWDEFNCREKGKTYPAYRNDMKYEYNPGGSKKTSKKGSTASLRPT
jgi:hypothetical protein